MKQLRFFYYLFTAILFSGMMLSCDDTNSLDDDENGSSSGTNNLKSGQIEIKAIPENKTNKISFFLTAKKVTIDWGDGRVDELTPNGVSKEFIHEYPNQNFQTIKVNTEGMTYFYSNSNSLDNYNNFGGAFQELRFGSCPELKRIDCYDEILTVLDVSKCTALTDLNCGDNQLTSLDVSKCTALTKLNCYYNSLTALDVSKCTALTDLDCSFNELTSLDVSKCTALTYLDCGWNQLTSLDVSKCTALTDLNCGHNQLTSLDVSKCTALTYLYCCYNNLSASALNALFNSLPTRKASDNAKIYYEYANPGRATCDKTIYEKKGWT